jgi:acyl-CoA reductase-like NAD-dependent aldehyde dehydrogenase
MDETQLQQIVSRVVAEVRAKEGRTPAPGAAQAGVFPDVDSAVQAATTAFRQLRSMPLALRDKLISGIRQTIRAEARNLAYHARTETGLGRVEDKVEKNLLVANATPGTEILRPAVITGDHGLTLTELAPFGVIGAITPSTNPTSTIVNNTISMVAAGNAVVFNAHPAAKGCSARTVELINQAVVGVGGPPNLVVCTAAPTIGSAQELMRHPGIRLLVVTGGPAVVEAAMGSGKRAICAGPGNPPAVVDETADIPKAARDIVKGASFDNNVVCTDEKEIIVVASVADALIGELKRNNVLMVGGHQLRQLEKALFAQFPEPGCAGAMKKEFVGKNPSELMRAIGVTIGDDVRLLVAEVPREHPLVWTEQLMPIVPLVRVRTADEAIDLGVAAEGGRLHTATMHSKNLDNLSRMAREINCSIFVKNGPNLAGLGYGGEGPTSFSIATPTGEGMTDARSFSRIRRCALIDAFRIV